MPVFASQRCSALAGGREERGTNQVSVTGWGFPGGSERKEHTCNAADLGSIPGLGRSPGGGQGNPLQCSCLENPHGQKSLVGYCPWGVTKSQTWLSKHKHKTGLLVESIRHVLRWIREDSCAVREVHLNSLDSFLPWEEGKGQRYYHTHCWGLTMLRLNPPSKPPKYAISHFGPFKLSGWFISFPWFCLIITKIWSKGPKRVEQTSYSSVQLKQTDLLLVQHSQRSPPHLFYWSCLASLFYTSSLLLLVMPGAK